MNIEKAKQVINDLILTKNGNEVFIVDKLQVGIAIKVLQDQLSDDQIKDYFAPKFIPEVDFQTFKAIH